MPDPKSTTPETINDPFADPEGLPGSRQDPELMPCLEWNDPVGWCAPSFRPTRPECKLSGEAVTAARRKCSAFDDDGPSCLERWGNQVDEWCPACRRGDLERFAVWRDIEPDDICEECGGTGKKTYASTAIWSGGVGGQVMTSAQCDACWGSGSKSQTWCDMRALGKVLREHPEVAEKLRSAGRAKR